MFRRIAKPLGDHSQTRFEIIRNAVANIILAIILPFVSVFTSSKGLKDGLKTNNKLKYVLNGVALVLSLAMFIIVPFMLHAGTSPKVAELVESKVDITSILLPSPEPSSVTSSANYGSVTGITEFKYEEVLALITKNIEQSESALTATDFKVEVVSSNSDKTSFYIFKKDNPKNILYIDGDNVSNVIPLEEANLFRKDVLKEPIYEKGTVTITEGKTGSESNDVLITLQSKTIVYGLTYNTNSSVDYAMTPLNQIIINSNDSVITTYRFSVADNKDLSLYNATVKALVIEPESTVKPE